MHFWTYLLHLHYSMFYVQIVHCRSSHRHRSFTQFMRSKLTLLSLCSRRRFMRLQLVYKIINNIDCPRQLKGYLVKRPELHDHNCRDSSVRELSQLWVNVALRVRPPVNRTRNIRHTSTLGTFKCKLFNYFLNLDVNLHIARFHVTSRLIMQWPLHRKSAMLVDIQSVEWSQNKGH